MTTDDARNEWQNKVFETLTLLQDQLAALTKRVERQERVLEKFETILREKSQYCSAAGATALTVLNALAEARKVE